MGTFIIIVIVAVIGPIGFLLYYTYYLLKRLDFEKKEIESLNSRNTVLQRHVTTLETERTELNNMIGEKHSELKSAYNKLEHLNADIVHLRKLIMHEALSSLDELKCYNFSIDGKINECTINDNGMAEIAIKERGSNCPMIIKCAYLDIKKVVEKFKDITTDEDLKQIVEEKSEGW